jgi:alpha-D-ribose 1-methylphosphonate 5-triphosphate synthase subunit PhnH
MSHTSSVELAGFADPVADAQRCFRAVLGAMARPGSVHAVGAGLTAPPPLSSAMAAVLLTLVDSDTRLWLAPRLRAAREWIVFHSGAVCVEDPELASFVAADTLPDLAMLRIGSHEAPETSATVIIEVSGFDTGQRYRLRGPGLRDSGTLGIEGLPGTFATVWADNHACFPRGVDLILCAGSLLAALPRSVVVEDA